MKIKSVLIGVVILLLIVGCSSQNNIKTSKGNSYENEIEFQEGELLPLGSVVLLKEGTKKLMIIGRIQSLVESEEQIFDYSSVSYPEGIINPRELFLFNNEDIEKVYFKGYEDDEELEFREFIKQKVNELNIKL